MWKRPAALLAVLFFILPVDLMFAQTLGNAPMFNRAVQGQSGAQPEGALFNFINWIGNVIAPVGAGGAVFGAIVAYLSGRAGASRQTKTTFPLAHEGLPRDLIRSTS